MSWVREGGKDEGKEKGSRHMRQEEERDERKSRNLLNILLRERDFAREAYEKFHIVVANGSMCVLSV